METTKPEVIEISSLGNAPVITLNKEGATSPPPTPKQPSRPATPNTNKTAGSLNLEKPSVNFGGGIELLMNDKRKNDGSKSPKASIDLSDINNLENELNDLSSEPKEKAPTKSSMFSKLLSGKPLTETKDETPINIEAEHTDSKNNDAGIKLNIGKETASGSGNETFPEKTWDGFSKFNNVPIDPDKEFEERPKLSPEEEVREKFKMLRKLEALEKKGIKLSRKYNMDADLKEMEGEYEVHLAERERSASCKFQGRMLMAAITGLEFLNNRFDPFDVKLEGWAEQVNENLDDYDEIFGELHEKYKSKAKMAPELKLLFQLGGSAIMVHMTNTMFKSAMPGMDDIMRQNPELMQQFTQAAANSMGQQNPGFGGFMSGLMQDRPMPPPNVAPGPPPAPMPKQQLRTSRSSPMNRPDLNQARGINSNGTELESRFGSIRSDSSAPSKRPEMKGPSDVSQLLAGLKSKNIEIPSNSSNDKTSTVSASDLKNMSTMGQMPNRTKRRQKSDKNVVSLAL